MQGQGKCPGSTGKRRGDIFDLHKYISLPSKEQTHNQIKIFNMNEEGCCTSEHVVPVPVSQDEDVLAELDDLPNHPKTFTFLK